MRCEACEGGRHFDCGMQSWCECTCDPFVAEIDLCFESAQQSFAADTPYGFVDGEPDYTLDDLEWSEIFE
jgi:hypothetical protein